MCHWGKYSAVWNKPLTFYELILICTKYLAILTIYSLSRHGGCLEIIIEEHIVLIGKPIIIIYIFLHLGHKFREIFLHKTMNPLKHWSVWQATQYLIYWFNMKQWWMVFQYPRVLVTFIILNILLYKLLIYPHHHVFLLPLINFSILLNSHQYHFDMSY